MAKGQVSEEQLSQGLKGIGNFGGLSSSRVQRDNPFRDSRSAPTAPPEPIKPASPPVVEPAVKALQPTVRKIPVPEKATPKPEKQEDKPKEGSPRKADIFSERVTLQISPEMRDEVDSLARELQRAKLKKEERITANTVMRVAIQLLLARYTFEKGEVANNEEELFRLVTNKLKPK